MFCFFSFNVYLSSKEGKADFGFSLFHKSARKDYLEAQFLGESLGYIAMPHYLLIDILLPFLVNFIKATLYTHPALPLPVAYIKPSRKDTLELFTDLFMSLLFIGAIDVSLDP